MSIWIARDAHGVAVEAAVDRVLCRRWIADWTAHGYTWAQEPAAAWVEVRPALSLLDRPLATPPRKDYTDG